MRYSVTLTSETNEVLKKHLLRHDRQEDLCFALWYPGFGKDRETAIIHEVILPMEGDRSVHGNASVHSTYLDKVTQLALKKRAGIAFMHSHLTPGWQNMSTDDVNTELRLGKLSFSVTKLPLLGLTLGTDGSWSARFWKKNDPKKYSREWCESVRVIGENGLSVTYNDSLLPPPGFREELKRTISAWGQESQQKLSRLRIGVVGLGSVGSMVAESLVRMGIQEVKLIDFDVIEKHNLDRLLHAQRRHINHMKVDVIAESLEKNATAKNVRVDRVPYAVSEDEGFREAISCDILFSCVDRPLGRYVLNYISYAYLIPVIDGGIRIDKTKRDKIRHASWRFHNVYPGRKCLACHGQYDPNDVSLEREGRLDDPTYINNLSDDHPLKRNENVFCFSSHLASSQVLHMLHLVLSPAGISESGPQTYHFPTSSLESDERDVGCFNGCYFESIVGRGDSVGLPITAVHPIAERNRKNRYIKKTWRDLFKF